MRKLLNTEIADYIYEEMEKKNKEYDVEYNKILTMIDDSISLDNDIEKDENGDILKEMTEEEIITLKNNMLDGVEEYFDSINEEF